MNRWHYCCAEERLLWAGNTKSLKHYKNLHFLNRTNFFFQNPTIGEVISLNFVDSKKSLKKGFFWGGLEISKNF